MTAPARPRRPAPGVVPAGPRLAARARAERTLRRRARRRRGLRALAVLLPLLVLAWLVLFSPVLAADRIEVSGAVRLAPEQVVDAAGVEVGTPLARVDVEQVAARVGELAVVADVRVRRVWPGTLRIEVAERAAVAGVPAGPDGRDGVLLVDAEGVGFATEPTLPVGLARVEVATPATDDSATRAALQVLLDLPDAVADSVAVVRAGTPSDVSFVLTDGRTVVWGAPEDAAVKAAAVTALLAMPGEYFDVSAPGVAVRRAPPG